MASSQNGLTEPVIGLSHEPGHWQKGFLDEETPLPRFVDTIGIDTDEDDDGHGGEESHCVKEKLDGASRDDDAH